ncbi:hypothetical protein [Arthrobacter sp. NPDC089319]|uniref:hypothetical protein n=1 Tax=Arthrobacter sp. NPDC089319 TaxID=3155915 RepID=UPI003415BF6D
MENNGLDLSGAHVLTEAATGPYMVTPVIAALAGAEVTAVTTASRYGTVREVADATAALADSVGVADRITVTDHKTAALFEAADIITNSGHLRPITGAYAEAIRPDCVVSLMFEAWELDWNRLDIDLQRLHQRGIRIAGTNERHPLVNVFSYLGPMAVAQLSDAGVPAYGSRIALICDNPFHSYLVEGLARAGAQVQSGKTPADLVNFDKPEAIVVSMTPTGSPVIGGDLLRQLALQWPTVVLSQFWGDISREECREAGLAYWPIDAPAGGHMGVLPSRLGPDPIVRLQAGGLKVAQVLRLDPPDRTEADWSWLDDI